MKLTIKIGDIKLEYEDGYSKLEEEIKDRIESILKTIHTMQSPTIISNPIIGTVDEIFNKIK